MVVYVRYHATVWVEVDPEEGVIRTVSVDAESPVLGSRPGFAMDESGAEVEITDDEYQKAVGIAEDVEWPVWRVD